MVHKGRTPEKEVVKTMTIGFPFPLYADAKFEVFVKVNEPNVDAVAVNVIWATEVPGEGGQPNGGNPPFPP